MVVFPFHPTSTMQHAHEKQTSHENYWALLGTKFNHKGESNCTCNQMWMHSQSFEGTHPQTLDLFISQDKTEFQNNTISRYNENVYEDCHSILERQTTFLQDFHNKLPTVGASLALHEALRRTSLLIQLIYHFTPTRKCTISITVFT